MSNDDGRDDGDFETITPARIDLAQSREGGAQGSRPGAPRVLWVALALLLAVGAAVVFVLPERLEPVQAPSDKVAEKNATAKNQGASGGSESGNEEPAPPPWKQLQLERQRKAAQDILANFVELEEKLTRRAVKRWGAETLKAARKTAERGDNAFVKQRYPLAQTRYRKAVSQLEALFARREDVRGRAVARGQKALAAGNAERARSAFDLALAITADHEPARVGLERAKTLDELRALLERASEQRESGKLEASLATLQHATDLDPRSEQARRSLAAVQAAISARRYRAGVSRGYAALADDAFERARTAFQQAREIRPDASEVSQGLRMVEQAATSARIETLQHEAERLEGDGRWKAAADRYAQALELDATLAFARSGKREAERRAQLKQQMEAIFGAPEKLRDEAAYATAEALLARARRIDDAGPQLKARIARLDELLQVAATPVEVTLRSDGKTRVMVYQVGKLGTFERRTLELKPGVYTAVGARSGYRDVRKQFRVTPEGLAERVRIASTEKI